MPGCLGCPTSTSTTVSGIWTDFRNHYGPTIGGMSTTYRDELYAEDLAFYVEWANANGIADPLNDSNYAVFRKWFSWKLTVGSNDQGRLSIRKRDHVGLSCAPCPYDTNCSDIRATHMVGSVPATRDDHGIYYMKITSRGNRWGFECTYSGCSYLLDTGYKYFYV